MVPQNDEQIERIIVECKKMLNKRALASMAVGVTPIPGLDIGADVALLIELLPKITRKFGLSPDQIDDMDEKLKILIFDIIKKQGAKFAGRIVTKEAILIVLRKMGVRVTAKQVTKYIPIIGQAIAGIISYTAMRIVGNSHINECVNICHEIIESQTKMEASSTVNA